MEYLLIAKKRRDTVRAVVEASGDLRQLDEAEHCLRGLDHQLSSEQLVGRRNTNMQYRKLVLEEQRFQIQCGVNDPQALQQLSELFSRQSKHQARLRALID